MMVTAGVGMEWHRVVHRLQMTLAERSGVITGQQITGSVCQRAMSDLQRLAREK